MKSGIYQSLKPYFYIPVAANAVVWVTSVWIGASVDPFWLVVLVAWIVAANSCWSILITSMQEFPDEEMRENARLEVGLDSEGDIGG